MVLSSEQKYTNPVPAGHHGSFKSPTEQGLSCPQQKDGSARFSSFPHVYPWAFPLWGLPPTSRQRSPDRRRPGFPSGPPHASRRPEGSPARHRPPRRPGEGTTGPLRPRHTHTTRSSASMAAPAASHAHALSAAGTQHRPVRHIRCGKGRASARTVSA